MEFIIAVIVFVGLIGWLDSRLGWPRPGNKDNRP